MECVYYRMNNRDFVRKAKIWDTARGTKITCIESIFQRGLQIGIRVLLLINEHVFSFSIIFE